jgi:protein transport protein HofQ
MIAKKKWERFKQILCLMALFFTSSDAKSQLSVHQNRKKTDDLSYQQITLQTKLFLLNRKRLKHFGIDLNLKAIKRATPFNVMLPFASHFGPFEYENILQFSGKKKINLSIDALEEAGVLSMLASPVIIVANNETAMIETIKKRPMLKTIKKKTSLSYQSASIQVKVKPMLINHNLLRLSIHLMQEQFLDQDHKLSAQSLSSTVLIKPNKAVFLGGLKSEEKHNHQDCIPYIASIPIIGKLFCQQADDKINLEMWMQVQAKWQNMKD